jgi:hypothetical protein
MRQHRKLVNAIQAAALVAAGVVLVGGAQVLMTDGVLRPRGVVSSELYRGPAAESAVTDGGALHATTLMTVLEAPTRTDETELSAVDDASITNRNLVPAASESRPAAPRNLRVVSAGHQSP